MIAVRGFRPLAKTAISYMASKELSEDSTFYQKIEHNPDICSNCYRRLKYRFENQRELLSDELEYEHHVGFGYVGDKQNTGRPSIKRSYCSCGVIDQGVKFRPLNEKDIMDVAKRVESHLDDENIEFDTDLFYDAVKDGRGNPEWQFNEEVLIEGAVEKAVEAERSDDGTIIKGVT